MAEFKPALSCSELSKAAAKKPPKPKLGYADGMPVVAIGPKGGKIVGYGMGGKPIYAGSKAAQKLKATKEDEQLNLFTKVHEWLTALGVNSTVSNNADSIILSAQGAADVEAAFGVKPDKNLGKGKRFQLNSLMPHVGKPLQPAEAEETATLATSAAHTPDNAPFPNISDLKVTGNLGGSHGGKIAEDSKGNKYAWKVNGGETWVSRAEELFNRVAALVSPKPELYPKAEMMEHDGQQGVLLEWKDSDGVFGKEFGGAPVAKFEKHFDDIVQHHVLDWLMSNHDSHGANFLVGDKGLIAVDKGQAFKWIGQKKYEGDLANGKVGSPNPSNPIYVQFWDAVKSGKVQGDPVEAAADIINNVEKNLSEEQYQLLMGPYLEAAANGLGINPDTQWKKAKERLANLRADFEGLLSSVLGKKVTLPHEGEANFESMPETPVEDKEGKTTDGIQKPGWPMTKGNVTVKNPGNPPPEGMTWPSKYPGPGYASEVIYKGKTYNFFFGEADGKGVFTVGLPDGQVVETESPQKAADVLMLHSKGLPLDMNATEKKKNGIAYSATKLFKVKEFKADFEAAASADPGLFSEPPAKDTPIDATVSVHTMLSALPDGPLVDAENVPYAIQGLADVEKKKAPHNWPLPVPPGGVMKFTALDGTPQIVVAGTAKGDPAHPNFFVHSVADDGKVTLVDVKTKADGYSDYPKMLAKLSTPIPEKSEGDDLLDLIMNWDDENPTATVDPTVAEILTKPAAAATDGPLPVGHSHKVKKKGLGDVTITAVDEGFKVSWDKDDGTAISSTWPTLSAASDHVWVNAKGYDNAGVYKEATGKKKVPSGGGWKFWGLKTTAKPKPAVDVDTVVAASNFETMPDADPVPATPPAWDSTALATTSALAALPAGTTIESLLTGTTYVKTDDGKFKVNTAGGFGGYAASQLSGSKYKLVDEKPPETMGVDNWDETASATVEDIDSLPSGAILSSTNSTTSYEKGPDGVWTLTNKGVKIPFTPQLLQGYTYSLTVPETPPEQATDIVDAGFQPVTAEWLKSHKVGTVIIRNDGHKYVRTPAGFMDLDDSSMSKIQPYVFTPSSFAGQKFVKADDEPATISDFKPEDIAIGSVFAASTAYSESKFVVANDGSNDKMELWNVSKGGWATWDSLKPGITMLHDAGKDAQPVQAPVPTTDPSSQMMWEGYQYPSIDELDALPDGTQLGKTGGIGGSFTKVGDVWQSSVGELVTLSTLAGYILGIQNQPGSWLWTVPSFKFADELDALPPDFVISFADGASKMTKQEDGEWKDDDTGMLFTSTELEQYKVMPGGDFEVMQDAMPPFANNGDPWAQQEDAYNKKYTSPLPEAPQPAAPSINAPPTVEVVTTLEDLPDTVVVKSMWSAASKLSNQLTAANQFKGAKAGTAPWIPPTGAWVQGEFGGKKVWFTNMYAGYHDDGTPNPNVKLVAINEEGKIDAETVSGKYEASLKTVLGTVVKSVLGSSVTTDEVFEGFKLDTAAFPVGSTSNDMADLPPPVAAVVTKPVEDMDKSQLDKTVTGTHVLEDYVKLASVKDKYGGKFAISEPKSAAAKNKYKGKKYLKFWATDKTQNHGELLQTFLNDHDLPAIANYKEGSKNSWVALDDKHFEDKTFGAVETVAETAETVQAPDTNAAPKLPKVGEKVEWDEDMLAAVPDGSVLASAGGTEIVKDDGEWYFTPKKPTSTPIGMNHLAGSINTYVKGGEAAEPETIPWQKVPKKIYKTWAPHKKIAALADLPAGSVVVANGLELIKAESTPDSLWAEVETPDAAVLSVKEVSIQCALSFNGGSVTPPSNMAAKPKVKKKKYVAPPKKELTEEQKKQIQQAKDYGAWVKTHPKPSEPKHVLMLGHVQKGLLKSNSDLFGKMYAHVDGGKMILGAQPEHWQAFKESVDNWEGFPPYEEVDTPLGKMLSFDFKAMQKAVPEGTFILGPDGDPHPYGTEFEETEVVVKTFLDVFNEEVKNPGDKGVPKKWKPSAGGGDEIVIKFNGNDDEAKTKSEEWMAKHGLTPKAGPMVSVSTVYSFDKDILDKVVETKKEMLPKEVISPPGSFQQAPLPFSLGTQEHGEVAHNNESDLDTLDAITPGFWGHSVRHGGAGLWRDSQIMVKRVKGADGKEFYEVHGELLDFPYATTELTKKHSVNDAFRYTSGDFHPFDKDTGTHKQGTDIIEKSNSWGGYQGSVNGVDITVVHGGDDFTDGSGAKTLSMRNRFVAKIPVDQDVRTSLQDALKYAGIDDKLAMSSHTADDERLFIKSQLVRAGLGTKGYWGRDFDGNKLKRKNYANEAWLDEQIKKLGYEKHVENAQITIGPGGKHVVESDMRASDDKLSDIGAKFVHQGTNIDAVVGTILGGQGLVTRAQGYKLGTSSSGASAASDTGTGGSAGTMTRLARTGAGEYGGVCNFSSSGNKSRFCFHPRALKRTDWWFVPGDRYGAQYNDGGDCYVDGKDNRLLSKKSISGSHEVLFETGLAIEDLGGVRCNMKDKKNAIKKLNDEGITDVNGIPLDDFFITDGDDPDSIYKKLKENYALMGAQVYA